LSNSAGPPGRPAEGAAWLLGTLLSRECFLCAAPAGSKFLCADCFQNLPRLTAERCPVCTLPNPAAAICGACLNKPPRFDATQAVFRYEFPVDRLVQALKYAHRLASADFLGAILARQTPRSLPDMVLPVPLAPQRLAERGFNQALEIARPVAARLGLKPETHHVRRQVDTTPQASLPWKERARNIRHAFACDIDLSGLAILVIDDVMTTGATLNELAGTLKAHGAVRVENLVLARALKD